MALRLDLHKDYLTRALEASIASLKRSKAKGYNDAMVQLIEKDIALYQNALNTITEIK